MKQTRTAWSTGRAALLAILACLALALSMAVALPASAADADGQALPSRTQDGYSVQSLDVQRTTLTLGVQAPDEDAAGKQAQAALQKKGPAATQVSVGTSHAVALASDGTMWAWGNNEEGQLGDGTKTHRSTPVKVLSGVKQAVAGHYQSAAIKTDGSLWVWGWNEYGQVGDGTSTSRSKPVKIMSDVVAVSLGHRHSAAIKSDGSLWTWGNNEYGQLGDGTNTTRTKPVRVMSGVKQVSLGEHCSGAVSTNGILYTFGLGSYDNMSTSNTPVGFVSNVKQVSFGAHLACLLLTNGTLYAAGDSTSGQGTFFQQIMSDVDSACAGYMVGAAVKKDGTLWTFGRNSAGQVGNGTTGDSPAQPTKVLSGVKQASAGGNVAAVKTDATLWSWGGNGYGQVGDGTKTNRSKPVQIQLATALAGITLPQASYAYTGKAIKPAPTIKLSGTTLKSGTDYTVSYKNNVNAGTATVTATGKGSYFGTVSKTFKIKQWKRLAGSNALATMEQITKEYGKASVAIVATNANFKDSLAGAALAGGYNAPMLTTLKAGLADKAKSELKRMGVKTVYLVGSTAEVTAKVESQIKAMGITVKRVSAKTPSERAVAAAKQVKGRSDTVIIATQNNFKDALAISPYAYATKSPILYAEANKKLSSATVTYIKSAKFKKAIIVGGPVALPKTIESQLKSAGIAANGITRLAGSNQYKTAQVIAEWATGKLKNGTGGGTGLYQYASVKFQPSVKFSANKLGVARADDNKIGWKDALAGAALCGKNKAVLVLADAKNSAQAEAFVKASKAQITYGYVFGGTLAVPKATYDKLVKASL